MQTFIQQIINGLALGSIYALIALGYTMVYGVLRLINFAHGDVYMIGAFVGYYAAQKFGIASASGQISFGGALILMMTAMMASASLGVVIERFAYRPVRKYPRLTSLITAIGVSLLLENGGQVLFGADPKFFPILNSAVTYTFGSVTVRLTDIIIVVVSVSLMVLLQTIVLKTKLGKAMRAVSYNLDAAKLMGINTDFIIAFTFALGSALAAAAGILVSLSFPKIDPLIGVLTGLKAFVAAVLGGIGNITGAVLGGFLIGIAETMAAGYLPQSLNSYKDAVAFAILILVLLFKPAGLMGSVAPEKV
ncbi:MAG: branched-chain amino acid ABC transporter permease [Blastocatellia bacterium]|nr:branched-chain amino acid ABC transporter permease [Blastocatellia bacterium]